MILKETLNKVKKYLIVLLWFTVGSYYLIRFMSYGEYW
jgi:hypothetical protein